MKKIQEYLLVNYPLLWNVRLAPALLAIIILNAMAFIQGYGLTNIEWSRSYSQTDSLVTTIILDIILCVIVLILWLINYNRNNAFKSFYPTTVTKLWLEWLLVFGILYGIGSTPLTVELGSQVKLRQMANREQLSDIQQLLVDVKIFIPQRDYNFFKEDDTLSTKSQESGSMSGTYSLLSYSIDNTNTSQIQKQWLMNRDTSAIRSLMRKYLALEHQHRLVSPLNVDSWFQLIYHPPLFPITDDNCIASSDHSSANYLNYASLESGYNTIESAYNLGELVGINLFVIYMCLIASLLIMTSRLTSIKSWVIALISLGLISISFGVIISLFSNLLGSNEMLLPYFSLNLLLILSLGIHLRIILRKRIAHRFSGSVVVLLLLLVPTLMVLVYESMNMIYQINMFPADNDSYSNFYEDHFTNLLYTNVAFTIGAIYGVFWVVKKWKGIPET